MEYLENKLQELKKKQESLNKEVEYKELELWFAKLKESEEFTSVYIGKTQKVFSTSLEDRYFLEKSEFEKMVKSSVRHMKDMTDNFPTWKNESYKKAKRYQELFNEREKNFTGRFF